MEEAMKLLKCICVFIYVALFSIGDLNSAEKNKFNNPQSPSEVNVNFAQRMKQGFNLRVWLSNQMKIGLQAWDGGSESTPDGIGCEYPAGAMIEHLYGAGPLIGAIVDGIPRVTDGYNGWDARTEMLPEYNHLPKDHFWRTSVGNNSFDTIGYRGYYYNNNILVNRKGIDDDGDGLVDEDELDGFDNDGDWNPLTDDVGQDGLPDSIEISCDGVPYDSLLNQDPADDNFDPAYRDYCHPNPDGSYPYKNNKDIYTEKNYMSDHGEPHVDEDYGAISNSDLYCSATDTFRKPTIVGHVGIGAKVVNKSYAWYKNSSADGIVYLDYSFINVGGKPWQDVYTGMFVDPDLGPVNASAYYNHNYAAFDNATFTAYVHNPVDTLSTPLGFTLISATGSLDSLDKFFWWVDFTTPGHIDPGTNDSLRYQFLAGGMHPAEPIAEGQSPLSDTRFYYSLGKFQVNPGDTIKTVFALVSGYNVNDMLNNARRAKRIYAANGFIMPVVGISDSGNGKSITISWNTIDKSPFGNVVSYKVYHGTQSGVYTDSISTGNLSFTYTGLSSTMHYFAVAAIDDQGHSSAISDEVTIIPMVPKNFRLYSQQTSINLQWDASSDPDIAGYNIYRRVLPDSVFTKINSEVVTEDLYFDTAVTGDKVYDYSISGVDKDGYESAWTLPLRGRLIPPNIPKNFVVGTGESYLHLNWYPNTEEDFAGYNLYRKRDSDTGFVKLNSTLLTVTDYIERSIDSGETYQYYLEAVDRTLATSAPTRIWSGKITKKDAGILLITTYLGFSFEGSINNFSEYLLQRYKYTWGGYPGWTALTGSVDYFGINKYSSIVFPYENQRSDLARLYFNEMPILLKGYLLGGGKLFLVGKQLSLACYPYWYEFLVDVFGVDHLLEMSQVKNFAGAIGEKGFPNLFARQDVTIGNIERFPQIPESRVLYRMQTTIFDSTGNGQPVGISAVDPNFKAYYMSFPLYYLDSTSAQSLVDYVLNDFGEIPLDVKTFSNEIPKEYSLHDAFPNPFNPSTSIRFDIPKESDVSLAVYDVLGKEVTRLVDERKPPGSYKIQWDANGVSTGIYFYRISVYDTKSHLRSIETKKVILVK
jgi:hypothetical protein